jgi:hypothetical protein
LSQRGIWCAAALLLALQGTVALACGYCIEDKIAAVYDYAIVTRALGQKHQLVFFAIDGRLAPGAGTQRAIEALVEAAGAADRGSARVSVEAAALSLAFDPRRMSFAAMQKALERKLAAKKLTLLPLRVMDKAATLKTAR